MNTSTHPMQRRPSRRPSPVAGGLIGTVVGFAVGAVIYVVLDPVLEDSKGIVRELQGLLWNLVPLLTVVGAALGWWISRPRHR